MPTYMTCKHKRLEGDNYGQSCMDCGKQIAGYGYGGLFGSDLTGNEACIHQWTTGSEYDRLFCTFCGTIKIKPKTTHPLNHH